jgi:hypothetical protein
MHRGGGGPQMALFIANPKLLARQLGVNGTYVPVSRFDTVKDSRPGNERPL